MVGLYKHFKNRWYIKLWDVRNANNCKKVYTTYMSLYKNDFPIFTIWSRPKEEFDEIINRDGKRIKRFKRII